MNNVIVSKTEPYVRATCNDCAYVAPGGGRYIREPALVKRWAFWHAAHEGHRVEVDQPTTTVYDASEKRHSPQR